MKMECSIVTKKPLLDNITASEDDKRDQFLFVECWDQPIVTVEYYEFSSQEHSCRECLAKRALRKKHSFLTMCPLVCAKKFPGGHVFQKGTLEQNLKEFG